MHKAVVTQSRGEHASLMLSPPAVSFLSLLSILLCVLVLTVRTGEAGGLPEGPTEHTQFDEEGNLLEPSSKALSVAKKDVKAAEYGDVVNSFPQPVEDMTGLTLKDGNLWGMAGSDGVLYEMDPSSGAVISTLHLNPILLFDRPGGLGYDSSRGLFVASDGWIDKILLVDPTTGEIVSSFDSPGTAPFGVAYDSVRDGYWVADWRNEVIDLVDPTSGSVIQTLVLCCDTRIAGVGFSADADVLMFHERNRGRTYLANASDGTLLGDFPIPSAGINNGQGAAIRSSTVSGFLTNYDNMMIYEVDLAGLLGPASFEYWVPVVSHDSGAAGSVWRSDLALLNRNSDDANVSLTFFETSGQTHSTTTSLGPWNHRVLEDVVPLCGATGSGALKIESGQPLRITSRTYNLGTQGTFGQYLGCVRSRDGLTAGGEVWITQLSENSDFRSNIGFTNTGSNTASIEVTLFLSDGSSIGSFTVSISPGEWTQENQPFLVRFGHNDVTAGYAGVRLIEGSGLVVYGSVVDQRTNDPTTIPMQP
jgi:hypothetical protein